MRLSHHIRSAPSRILSALSFAAGMLKPCPADYAASGLSDGILSDIGISRYEVLAGTWHDRPAGLAD